MQVATTLKSHEPKTVKGRNGEFTIHIFKAEDGTRFQTSKQDKANAVYALLNQPVTIDFEQVQRGDWLNNEINSILAGHVAGVPTSVPNSNNHGRKARGGGFKDQGVINRSAALARAIELHNAGIVQIENRETLFKVAASLVPFIEGTDGSYSAPPQVELPSGAAAPTAPTAEAPATAPAAAPATPDDDIPF